MMVMVSNAVNGARRGRKNTSDESSSPAACIRIHRRKPRHRGGEREAKRDQPVTHAAPWTMTLDRPEVPKLPANVGFFCVDHCS